MMKVIDFVKSARGFHPNERNILCHKLLPLLRHRIKVSLENRNKENDKYHQIIWGEGFYEVGARNKSWQAHLVNNTRKYLSNLIYDLELYLDTNRDGKILGIAYTKPIEDVETPQGLNIIPEVDTYASMLGYTRIPVRSLSRRIDLGGGVIAVFRPPRSSYYTFSIWVKSDIASGEGLETVQVEQSMSNVTSHGVKQGLPAFQATEFLWLYASVRNSIERRITAFESRSIIYLQGIMWKARRVADRTRESSLVTLLCTTGLYIGQAWSHTVSFLTRTPMDEGRGGRGGTHTSRLSASYTRPNTPLDGFWSTRHNASGERAGGEASEAAGHSSPRTMPDHDFTGSTSSSSSVSCDDVHMTAPITETHEDFIPSIESEKSPSPSISSQRQVALLNTQEPLSRVLIGVDCADPIYGHHMALKYMKTLSLSEIPLVIPDPSPAASSGSHHHRHATLQLARAEFVMFTSFLVIGAAPAVYRSMNYMLAHPVYAQVISASLIGTLLYTAWNSRRSIRSSTTLRISDAIMARLIAQDETVLHMLRSKYADALAEAMVLIYTTELILMRHDEVEHTGGVAMSSGSVDTHNLQEFIQSMEYRNAQWGGDNLPLTSIPFVRDKMESIGLLSNGKAVRLDVAEKAITNFTIGDFIRKNE